MSENGSTINIIPKIHGERITWRETLVLFQDSEFVLEMVKYMNSFQIEKYLWETPPMILDSLFEFVIIRSDKLSSTANPKVLITEIKENKYSEFVSCFQNLGRDAVLIVPSGKGDYPHIGSFLRNASDKEILELFDCISDLSTKLSKKYEKFWVSTSGMSVSWLHVRIDQTPKYYSHDEYK